MLNNKIEVRKPSDIVTMALLLCHLNCTVKLS